MGALIRAQFGGVESSPVTGRGLQAGGAVNEILNIMSHYKRSINILGHSP